MENLYCFRVDEITGEIIKYEIPSDKYIFIEHKFNIPNRGIYKFDGSLIDSVERRYSVTEQKIDRFTNNKVFTHNPSIEDAKKFMLDTLEEKIKDAERVVKHCRRKQYRIKWFGVKK